MKKYRILICDDDSIFQYAVKSALKNRFECLSAYDGDEAIKLIKTQSVDILILDIRMKDRDDGLRILPLLLEIHPKLAIIVSTSMRDFDTVRRAMRLGAIDYVVKDFNSEDLVNSIDQVLARRSHLNKLGEPSKENLDEHYSNILIGESGPVRELRGIIKKAKKSKANIVITGETGTGKELVARQLRCSDTSPFLAVDSATIQSSMAESILFGHEKGAFTGAERTTKGLFEEANGGVVYFDEIANMPLGIQVKLLRILQEREVTRLGSSKTIKLEFRVICATNRNLEKMAQDGEFKADLLQRLNVIPIEVPSLQSRGEDIPLLLEHFIRKQPSNLLPIHFTDGAISVLQKYPWPGNVRELGNLVDYLSTMSEGHEITEKHLPRKFHNSLPKSTPPLDNSESAPVKSFYERVTEFEANLLQVEYSRYQGNISRLAIALGMDRSHLYSKLKEYKIHFGRDVAIKKATVTPN